MAKPFTLQPLIKLARHQNDTAILKLGQLHKQQHNAQGKLDMLMQYRRDYQARLQAATQQGIDPSELRNFQAFIDKLDEAIGQQLKKVRNSDELTQAGRNQFNTTQRKLKSFDTLQQRHEEVQKHIEKKSEQAAMDEHTSLTGKYRINGEIKTDES
jgi:flagellar FliJ protein